MKERGEGTRMNSNIFHRFAAFALLVVVSIGVTYWGLQTQRQDALIINLAGRQRMLVQQMTRLAYQLQNNDDSTLAALQESEQTFNKTLSACSSRISGSVHHRMSVPVVQTRLLQNGPPSLHC